jgi:hypothetical protein
MFSYGNNGWTQPLDLYQPTMSPYYSESFLSTTFNSNPASIEAFSTLSH